MNTPPTIIFSGGQGPDEGLPEAEAMQKYAVEKGIPLEHTVQENRSVNTYQNMLFSKEIMDSLKPDGKYKSIFTTNNFHLFALVYMQDKLVLIAKELDQRQPFIIGLMQ